MASISGPTPSLALLVPLLVVWFAFVAWGLSWMSGWRRMAEDFRAEADDRPESLKWAGRAQIGSVSYANCLSVGGDSRGLYLLPFILFRLSHPPLRIPWSELHGWERKRFLFSWTDTVRVRGAGIRLKLPSSTMEPLDPYLLDCR